MRLIDHVTLNFNSSISKVSVFLDIEKPLTPNGLLVYYKLSKLEFSASPFKLFNSFLSQRKFRISVEGEISRPREMQAEMPQDYVLSPTLYSMYIYIYIYIITPNIRCSSGTLC
jgi:hypothetical protein